MKPVSVVIVGAGCRGSAFAAYVSRNPKLAKVVGVAEPRESYRRALAMEHRIPPANTFSSWEALSQSTKIADAAIIATQDTMHVEPAVALSRKGYHILLEKPMAPDEAGCRRIIDAMKENGVVFSVAHVLRYTPYTQRLKAMIDSGMIGEVMCVQHLEPVGYWHQAHSYVRGNWRKESEASSMLMAKSCHDIDWLRYIVGKPCVAISSFGGLLHFRADKKPVGSAKRCHQCPVENSCPYSAMKIYLGRIEKGNTEWPVSILTAEVTVDAVTEALHNGPYGRCVYDCDNDVVDNQVVNMLFEGGPMASFTLTAFNQYSDRKTHVFGSRGHLYGDGSTISHFDFLTDTTTETRIDSTDFSILGGHAGGDDELMTNFFSAVRHGNPHETLTGADESLESHLLVLYAERSRKEGRTIALPC